MMFEEVMQAGLDHAPHPVQRLLAALGLELAARAHDLMMAFDLGPEFGHAFFLQGTHADHRRPPVGRSRAQHVQRLFPLRARNGRGARIDVALVDCHEVGDLDNTLLDRLQIVAGVRQLDQDEHVDHAGNRRFALPDTDRLDQNDVITRRFAGEHCLARLFGHTTE